jgi:hypothetical protein
MEKNHIRWNTDTYKCMKSIQLLKYEKFKKNKKKEKYSTSLTI